MGFGRLNKDAQIGTKRGAASSANEDAGVGVGGRWRWWRRRKRGRRRGRRRRRRRWWSSVGLVMDGWWTHQVEGLAL